MDREDLERRIVEREEPGLGIDGGRLQSSGSLPPAHSTSHSDGVPMVPKALTKTKITEQQLGLPEGSMNFVSSATCLMDHRGLECSGADVSDEELGVGLETDEGQEDSSADEGARKFSFRPNSSTRSPTSNIKLKPSTLNAFSANLSREDSGNWESTSMQENTRSSSYSVRDEDDPMTGTGIEDSVTNFSHESSGRDILTSVQEGSESKAGSIPDIPKSNTNSPTVRSREESAESLGLELRNPPKKDEDISHPVNVPQSGPTKAPPQSFREIWRNKKKEKGITQEQPSALRRSETSFQTTPAPRPVRVSSHYETETNNMEEKNSSQEGENNPGKPTEWVLSSYPQNPSQVSPHTSHSRPNKATEFDCGPFLESLVPSLLQLQQKMSFKDFSSTLPGEIRVTPWFVTKICALENTYSMLLMNVSEMEDEFEKNICFPDNDMKLRVSSLLSQRERIPMKLPIQLREAYSKRIESFADEYNDRNKTIQMYEDDAAQALIQEACKYYREEMNFIINEQEFCFKNLDASHYEIRKETLHFFVEAAGFKNKFWENHYAGDLAIRLVNEFKGFLNTAHNKIFESMKRKALLEFRDSLEAMKPTPSLHSNIPISPDVFLEISSGAKIFSKNCMHEQLKAIEGLQEETCVSLVDNFDKECEAIAQAEASSLVSCWKDESHKAPFKRSDSTNFEAEEKHNANTMDSNLPGPSASRSRKFDFAPPTQTQADPRASSVKSSTTPKIDAAAAVSPPAVRDHYVAESTFVGSEDEVDRSVLEFVIHFGLHRTLAGVFNSQTGDFQAIFEADNYLYLDNNEIIRLKSPNAFNYRGAEINFQNLILSHNMYLPCMVQNSRRNVRTETLISCMFAALKWKAELKFKTEFNSCVICVPQCLNPVQVRAVQDGATLADFHNFTVIQDTRAIALATVMQQNLVKGDIVVASTCEGFTDAAHFRLGNGLIICQAVSGKYFPWKTSGWRSQASQAFSSAWHNMFDKDYSEKLVNELKPFKFGKKAEESILNYGVEMARFIVVGNDWTLFKRIRDALSIDPEYKNIEKRRWEHTYPLRGAGYFAAITSTSGNPVSKRWASLTEDEDYQKNIGTFYHYLIVAEPGTKPKTTNPIPYYTVNLGEADLNKRKQDHILTQQKQHHSWKLHLLKKAKELQIYLSPRMDDDASVDVAAIQTACYDLQEMHLDHDKLEMFESNLAELFIKYGLE